MTPLVSGYPYRIPGGFGRDRRASAALALGVSLMAGLLMAAGAPGAQASTPPLAAVVDLPGDVAAVAVGKSGTVFATLPDQDAIAIARLEPQPQVRILNLPGTADPLAIAVTSDEAVAYVGRLPNDANPDGRLDRVDLATGAVTQIEGVGYWPNDLELSADDKTLVVAVVGQAEAVLVDTASDSVRERVRLRHGAGNVAIDGNIAFVGSAPIIDAIDIRTGNVLTTSPAFSGEVVSMTVMGNELIAAITIRAPELPRLAAFDARTLRFKRSLELQPAQPEFRSTFTIASSFSRVYAMWGLKWDIDGSEYPAIAVPSTQAAFGSPQPFDTNLDFVRAIGADATGALLAVVGFSTTRGSFVIQWYPTGDERRSVAVQARLKGRTLTVAGSTTGVTTGAAVRVFVRQGKKFVAQKKTARVGTDGTFTWRANFRKKPTRVYVTVGGIESSRVTVRR